ncbi:MAG: hypothetical protein FJ403_20720 [Verrucomicrobia bacterium]|nr:hypothetical protein [Verrucomicrobiota bacterium]
MLHYGQVSVSGSTTLTDADLRGTHVNFVFPMEKLCLSLKAETLISEVPQALLGSRLAVKAVGRQAVRTQRGEWVEPIPRT